jgi:hypothetical protein
MTTNFFNLPKVQASVHDFCNFNKNFGKILEKKADVQKKCCVPYHHHFLQP